MKPKPSAGLKVSHFEFPRDAFGQGLKPKRATIERQERAGREAERANEERTRQRDGLVYLEARTFDRFIQSQAETDRLKREHDAALRALEAFSETLRPRPQPSPTCPMHGTPMPCEFRICRAEGGPGKERRVAPNGQNTGERRAAKELEKLERTNKSTSDGAMFLRYYLRGQMNGKTPRIGRKAK